MSIQNRLVKLERAASKAGVGICRLCYGSPICVVEREHEIDPDGPGFRPTGVERLITQDRERVTEDFRCIRCGKQAVKIIVLG